MSLSAPFSTSFVLLLAFVPAPRDEGEEIVEGSPMLQAIAKDKIPAVDQPVFVSGEEADFQMLPDEPVLGVVGPRGTAKAYSAWQLEHHEIVNDTIDGVAIAVTW